ncbi:DUF2515 family protein [Pseudalkalibacillus hwajinpoensis]|uniref:DUF2515 domain-containing protein n=1 Tax=Guptibacillus hwajinpoensis TaxID=208199 RepID=A0A4U1MGT0_9BACL|nr:DUF2515 family protein [Pseudalkalibacillus hwajinpoensis]TKD70479.1 DUF2515 domain-containing protein [Pseudalkalibacillus hwajinpoensis]
MAFLKSLFQSSLSNSPSTLLLKELQHNKQLPTPHFKQNELQLINTIQKKTATYNRNNVTRTKAYLDFFQQHPEIHWSMLAHLVSRNAGWTMTDLKGEYLPRLLTRKQQEAFFSFLERGNWLIFQDAYPQLLLYHESMKKAQSLFHLLPAFHVSSFMKICWNDFLTKRKSDLLTIALIINEQHYIESRVIQMKDYQQTVFHTLAFQLQEILNTNTLLFPKQNGNAVHLMGETAHHFLYVKERINLGKRLYAQLFSSEQLVRSVLEWAESHPHTGSRKDYWPHLYNTVKDGEPNARRELKNCTIIKGPRIYSPPLSVWNDVTHTAPHRKDWFTSSKSINLFHLPAADLSGNIEKTHCSTIALLEKLPTFLK